MVADLKNAVFVIKTGLLEKNGFFVKKLLTEVCKDGILSELLETNCF